MNEIVMVVVFAVLGLCFGSFANATAWRFRKKKSISTERSECEHCHRKLAWYDLIPIVSWLLLQGKCRYCHKEIGAQHLIVEAGTAALLVASYMAWPYDLTKAIGLILFLLWVVALIKLVILFVYDLKWLLLPDRVVFPLIAVGVAMAALKISISPDVGLAILNTFAAVMLLSGLYLGLFLISKGKWVGFGDVKLGLFLGLALGEWQLALLCLFLANFIGCLIVIPGMYMGKLTRNARVPFGPLLIAGFIIAMLWGHMLIDWYLSATGLSTLG